MLDIGSIVGGKYKILNKIGEGGMSTVYLGMNERANRQWAIKEIRRENVRNYDILRESLRSEIEILRSLRHPCLPGIVDVIDEDGRFLIVMDYIEGNTLKRALDDYGPQPEEYVIAWAKQLCDVLSYLHSQKPPVIYRDMKPGNIMLQPNGSIRLIDFGTAREYKEENEGDTTWLGTRGYAAPEQFGGQGQTDARTDIYCLGATLYHLVTGKNPADPPYEMRPIREIDPTLSEGLEKIIWKCTRPDPKERYQSCDEVWYALEHYDELNQEFRKRQKLKLMIFLLSFVSAASFLTVGLMLRISVKTLREDYYQKFMENALVAENESEKNQGFKEAIRMHPEEADPWIKLMEQVYLADNDFSASEDEDLRTLLITEDDEGISYEESLLRNSKAAGQVAYKYGLVYFYDYESTGNPGMALKWLNIAAKSSGLEKHKADRAKRLEKISEYYTNIGVEDRAGDVAISYRDYWEDLAAVTRGDIAKEDNPTTAVMVYRQTIGRIYESSSAFRDAGVSMEEMTALLSEIREHIKKDLSDINDEKIKSAVEELENSALLAEKSIHNTFSE
ncbi:serine/threonine protein kinase [Lachnospiraceae bacterium]|nr:serine/threonine protein kinase [Lachnospiraceae bacterium]